jgi:divalent metal cation (Fe/Co/Zn/Cd) transporter
MKQLLFSLSVNLFLFVAKLLTGITLQSSAILAEAIHSVVDVLSAFFALLSIKLNREHLAKPIEACVLVLGSFWVLHELLQDHAQVQSPLIGIGVCVLSLIGYLLVYKLNHAHASSHAVAANLVHIVSDIGTSIVTILALFMVYLTGWVGFDRWAALGTVIWLLYLAYRLVTDPEESA